LTIIIELSNNNVNGQLTQGLQKIDRGDNVCILGGPKIQAAQLR